MILFAELLLVALAVILYWIFLDIFKVALPTLFGGAIYVPTRRQQVKEMIQLANIQPHDRVADLGSGDGRIVISVAKLGATVDGFEILSSLVRKSRKAIQDAGVEPNAQIFNKNFWHVDLSSYDVIFVFGMKHMMKRLEKKLISELKPGSRIILNTFTFPTLKPTHSKKNIFSYSLLNV